MTPHEKAVEAAARTYLRELDIDPDMPHGGRPGAKIWWTVEAQPVAAAISAYLASMREQGWEMVPTEGATLEEVRKLLEDAKKAFDEIAMLAAQESRP